MRNVGTDLQEDRFAAPREHWGRATGALRRRRLRSAGFCARLSDRRPHDDRWNTPAGGRAGCGGGAGTRSADSGKGIAYPNPAAGQRWPEGSSGVPLDVVRGGQQALVAELSRASRNGVEVLAPDVETDEDLQDIASALRVWAGGRISAGSAGLAEHLAQADQDSDKPADLGRSACVAAVVGTPSVPYPGAG